MPTKVNEKRLRRLLRENLGLASEKGAESKTPIISNEKPVQPVVPTPSVEGSETGDVKARPAFETNPVMRKLGKLLSGLSDKQQASVLKKLRDSTKKKKKTNEAHLATAINRILSEIDDEELSDTEKAAQEDAYLDMIDSGDAEVEIDEELLQDILNVGEPPQENNANLRREKYTKAELANIDLMDPALRTGVNALTVGEVIDAISIQMGLTRSAVTNPIYDYMKKVGDSQIRRRPSERRSIPTSADHEKFLTAENVEKMIYDDFVEQFNDSVDVGVFPERDVPFPGYVELQALPVGDDRKELFRNYQRLLLSVDFMPNDAGKKIFSSIDLIANWHLLFDNTGLPMKSHGFHQGFSLQTVAGAQKVELNDGTKGVLVPHSEDYPLTGHIRTNIQELVDAIGPDDFEQYLKRAVALMDAGKTAGGQGWKGVVGKVDKEAEKVAKKKAKAKAKAAKKKK